MSENWIEGFLDDLEELNEPISMTQIGIIEGLLNSTPLTTETKTMIESELLEMRYGEAQSLIVEMRENEIPIDCRKQFEKMVKNKTLK